MSSDSSDDDAPLAGKLNGRLSSSRISKEEDKAVDRSVPKPKVARPGLSVRHGPITGEPMDVDGHVNGSAKRKSRSSISKINYKDDSEDSDDVPVAKRKKSTHKPADSDSDDEPISLKKGQKLPPSYKEIGLEESSDDDEPLGVQLSKKKASIEKKAEKEAKTIRAKEAKAKKATPKKRPVDSDSDSDVPVAKSSAKRKSNGVSSAKKTNGTKVESDSDEPMTKKKLKALPKGKAKTITPAKKASKLKVESEDAGDDGEDENGEWEWWKDPKREDDSIKWETLEHSGVLFAPEYEPLPNNVKLIYDHVPVNLHIEAEETAYFFGSMLHSTINVENPVFQKNFFGDFRDVLKATGGATDKKGNKVDIKDFAKCDFTKMHEYWTTTNEAKKNRSKEEKKAEKERKDKLEAPFMFCKWDGRKEKVGNFRVEPPGLFRGRGEHPKTGKVKKRVMPEQITINIGKGAKVPQPPPGHKWKAVQHDNKATWLAMWQENINGNYKYVMLAANSAIKGQSDFKKFEKARALKKYIDKIRRDYNKNLKDEKMETRQLATAVYLIDKLALRAGNEKNAEEEAETVGCCSLKFEHISLEEPPFVVFDFLGKDSIRYYDRVEVDRQVFKNLKLFKRAPKTDGDDIFDRLDTGKLNKFLSSYMTGLTAKVFRTYNASYTMAQLLKECDGKGKSIPELIKLYNDCNRKVAVLCNHKRTVGAAHEAAMEKMGDQIKGQKYQLWRLKNMLLDIDSKQKKKKGADFFQLDEDLTQEWVKEWQAKLVEDERTKITKAFAKANEKAKAEGEKPAPEKELKEKLKAADELATKFKKENKSGKVEAEGKSPTVDAIEGKITKAEERIRNLELKALDREDNKEVALGTSKINYIDPRLTVVFSKKFNVPIDKFFSKTLRDKFNWAIKSVEDENWEF